MDNLMASKVIASGGELDYEKECTLPALEDPSQN